MSELLHGWYVDSSPGCGASDPEKCGHIIPSLGIVGQSTLTPPEDVDVSALAGRSLNPPGTIPADSTPEDRAPLYVLMKDVVWFDGHSALYQLPRHADSGDFAMSFWYNPYEDEHDNLAGPGTFGVVYAGPAVDVTVTDGSGTDVAGSRFFRTNPASIAGDTGAIEYQRVSGTGFAGARYSHSTFGTDPIDDMQGWCHVMMSVQRAGGTSKLTMWIDETEIVTAHDIGDVATMPFADATFFDNNGVRHCWTIGGRTDQRGGSGKRVLLSQNQKLPQHIPAPGGSATFVSKGSGEIGGVTGQTYSSALHDAGYEQIGTSESTASYVLQGPPTTYDVSYVDGGGTHVLKGSVNINTNWYIPGDVTAAGAVQGTWAAYVLRGTSSWKGSLPTDGCGLVGAITELWIAPGQFIDWSDQDNRDKFHTSDLVGEHFAPVDLGDDGSTPTGTKPLIYCTGAPQQFKVNRAKSKTLTVYRNSVGGLVGELLDYLKPPT